MAATDYFEKEMDMFIRGYTSVREELLKHTPKQMHHLLHKSYLSVETASYLGTIERSSTLLSISRAIDEFNKQISPTHPELCI